VTSAVVPPHTVGCTVPAVVVVVAGERDAQDEVGVATDTHVLSLPSAFSWVESVLHVHIVDVFVIAVIFIID
jgi:hypothetical protein